MSRPKKKLSKNAEIVITCIITLALCVAGYVFTLMLNTPSQEGVDKRAIIIEGLNNYKKVLPVLSDSLAPSLIIWCIIGLITNFCKTNYLKTSKIHPSVAIPAFILYLIWYIVYLVLKEIFFEVVIVNVAAFIIVLGTALLFFNEHKKKVKQ